MWTSLVCRQIVIDVGDIPLCFNPDVPGLEFLHEGQETKGTISLCLSVVDLSNCRYDHLELPRSSAYIFRC